MPTQFITDVDGERTFAVMPYPEYLEAFPEEADQNPANCSLLAADGYTIKMPHGGPGRTLDARQFVHVWLRRGTVSMALEGTMIDQGLMAVNARKQAYSDFKKDTINSLDPILRRCFLPENSPYRDTMQATVRLVDALVETGVFKRTMVSGPGYYRPVQGIEIDEDKAHAFLAKYGQPDSTIDPHKFILV